jgi:hypothetical protein
VRTRKEDGGKKDDGKEDNSEEEIKNAVIKKKISLPDHGSDKRGRFSFNRD